MAAPIPSAQVVAAMPLPSPRGPLSQSLIELVASEPRPEARLDVAALDDAGPVVSNDDLQLSLFCCNELHYRGIAGVDDRWEWHPTLAGLRNQLDHLLEVELRASVRLPEVTEPDQVVEALIQVTRGGDGPSLSRYIGAKASLDQAKEFLVFRSIYQLKEADPHTWALPRVQGPAKAALLEIQADEYGNGDYRRMHSVMFAEAMAELGLDVKYGSYLDCVPAAVLAGVNAISMFGLHRRLRGAAVGHLAAIEMTSAEPMRRYARGLRRLGLGERAQAYFWEHVEADAAHEQIAAHDMVRPLVQAQPELAEDVLFGAAVAMYCDDLVAESAIEAWSQGRSALRVAVLDAA